ncbi:MAG: hypothetical protein IVW53_13145 [Chloroflexi bacterium]|nr:hypothetical protein [Chloroflexota bacterium]
MPLQYVASRRGRRGHPVSPDRIGRMSDIVEVIDEQTLAITARHLFYLLTMRPDARQPIPKTNQAYERVLIDLLALRRSGDVAWSAITDGTRTKTRWVGYGDLAEAAEQWQRSCRRDIWRNAPATCEVWSESRGLLGTINQIAGEYGVPTLGVGGFNSATIGWETAQDVKRAIARGQEFSIFHFGDLDPSGQAVGASAEREIRSHLTGTEQESFHFEARALTAEQVREYDLPSAPVKLNAKTGKPRGGHADSWDGGTTELDALPPVILQELVRDAIESLIDDDDLAATRLAEQSERDILGTIAATMGKAS